MLITLKRQQLDEVATLGDVYVDGAFECYSLERANEGKGHIPAGAYKVIIDYSDRFGREMPHILDVPGFTGIRIHPGNTVADTEGCILVGDSRSQHDFIGSSQVAFERLRKKLAAAGGVALISIEDDFNVAVPTAQVVEPAEQRRQDDEQAF